MGYYLIQRDQEWLEERLISILEKHYSHLSKDEKYERLREMVLLLGGLLKTK